MGIASPAAWSPSKPVQPQGITGKPDEEAYLILTAGGISVKGPGKITACAACDRLRSLWTAFYEGN